MSYALWARWGSRQKRLDGDMKSDYLTDGKTNLFCLLAFISILHLFSWNLLVCWGHLQPRKGELLHQDRQMSCLLPCAISRHVIFFLPLKICFCILEDYFENSPCSICSAFCSVSLLFSFFDEDFNPVFLVLVSLESLFISSMCIVSCCFFPILLPCHLSLFSLC